MADYDYDLFVIGAGSGGVRAARLASNTGARVAIAEEYRVGGTCVIRGCVPKKLFVYASRFGDSFEDARGFGWTLPAAAFDWRTLISNKDREIDRLNSVYLTNLERVSVEVIMSRAIMRDAHTIYLVGEDRAVTAKTILIATGAAPFVPDLPGAEHAITSNEAFHLPALPERIAVIGGGYIAVEFAGIFSGLGVKVDLIYRGEQILRGFDRDLRDNLAEELRKRGIDVRVNTVITQIEAEGSGYVLTCKNGDTLETDLVMYATGRKANTVNLGLEKAGVEMDRAGSIQVDDYSRTSAENIYAVGDVTGRVALTPVAIHEGAAFVETVFKNNPTPVDHRWIATAVFSEPELGTVGLTEEQARESYGGVDIYKSLFRPMKHTLSGRDEKMLMKLIVDPATDRVIGCHIMGPDAGEMAQLLGISIRMGATKSDFDATMAVHPTAAEELVTMSEKWVPTAKEAAE